MKNNDNNKSSFMPVLVLLFSLCLCAAIVISSGALIYKSTVDQMDKNYVIYTSVQFIQEKFRQNDCIDSVRLIQESDTEMLVFEDRENDVCTYIYCYEGWLMELLTIRDTEPVLSAGQRLTNLASMDIEEDMGLFRICVRDIEGNSSAILLSMTSGGNNE